MLTAAEQSDPDDLPLLRALGITAELNGDDSHAQTYYRAVLKKDPENLAAVTNLGTLLARAGDLEAATRPLGKILPAERRHPGAWTKPGQSPMHAGTERGCQGNAQNRVDL
jgi:Flp pilus assembly protein TadD